MSFLSRSVRLCLAVFIVVIAPTLYLVYPSGDPPPALGEYADHYQAGGIDSEHWREPVVPNFEADEGRAWSNEKVLAGTTTDDNSAANDASKADANAAAAAEEMRNVISGGVIMPKLENATAK
jgi:FAD-linked sulfhydryl oxidase